MQQWLPSMFGGNDETIEDTFLDGGVLKETPVQEEEENLLADYAEQHDIIQIYILDKEKETSNKIINSSNTDLIGRYLPDPDGRMLKQTQTGFYVSTPYRQADSLDYSFFTGSMLEDGRRVILEIDARQLYNKLEYIGQQQFESYEVVVVVPMADKAIIINPLTSNPESVMKMASRQGDELNLSWYDAAFGEDKGFTEDINQANNEVLTAWARPTLLNWAVLHRVNKEEAMNSRTSFMIFAIVSAIVILALALLAGLLFSQSFTRRLQVLRHTTGLLGKGTLPNPIEVKSKDEVGQMAKGVNKLVKGLKNTAGFANEIGDGNFDSEFTPMSQDDTLGTALLSMRDSLQDAAKRDDERNWIVRGVAEISVILRQNNNIEPLSDEVISFLVDKTGAVQGAFYTVIRNEESGKQQPPIIFMTAAYAYNKKKYIKREFEMGEGLVGQSVVEQDIVLRTEIPDDYVSITSGLLGEKKPECLLIVPLISNEVVYGAIELASIKVFSELEVNFIKEISQILAQTIFNILVNERTRNLLSDAQKMSSELQQQQEELRQNAEEMAATQEELKRTNIELENQVQEVNRAQQKMQTLLQKASEVITIYEKDMTIRYISPSVEFILGYPYAEMIGIKDMQYIDDESIPAFEKMFEQLLEDPTESVAIQYQYKQKNGEWIWLEATGTNQLADPSIEGIVVNSRDITERRRAEKEARMRGQMQSLSENSPDLITRLSRDEVFFYVNPVIKEYTGHDPEYFLQKPLADIDMPEEQQGLLKAWQQIIGDAVAQRSTIAEEIDFESIMGKRVVQVNAIPEYATDDEDSSVESVLVVSHDITDRKLIELEIQSKNKKITESINYAKRIQTAILPDNKTIKDQFPESFIYYKPRDVVSGDFPWYLEKGDDIYIAAVDCTGHGVPGALISLIGYFLLNNIIEGHQNQTPANILDLLDIAVTKTLRQDGEDSVTRDGMDIALCKINKKKNKLEYAGAHRPLYYLRNGELEEYKGDKFPIGGGQYRNRDNFNNLELTYKKGDTAVFFSDGFPDQFGGPRNRKFSPRRIREMVTSYSQKPMEDMEQAVGTAFEEWKNGYKQTDDVLMIGLRF